jgi:hypothetical protein
MYFLMIFQLTILISAAAYVLSVKSNFPIYHGWNIAQKIDASTL